MNHMSTMPELLGAQRPNLLAVGGPNSTYARPHAAPAGFWSGLWHGLICPLVFVASLIWRGVRMYEQRNSGRWYDLGFLLGTILTLASGAAGVRIA